MGQMLKSWTDGAARRAIIDFVERVCGPDGVAVEDRVDSAPWRKPIPH